MQGLRGERRVLDGVVADDPGFKARHGQKRLDLALDQQAKRRFADEDLDAVGGVQAHRAAAPEAPGHEPRIAHRGEAEPARAHPGAFQIPAHRTAQHAVERPAVEQPFEGGIDDGRPERHAGENRRGPPPRQRRSLPGVLRQAPPEVPGPPAAKHPVPALAPGFRVSRAARSPASARARNPSWSAWDWMRIGNGAPSNAFRAATTDQPARYTG